MATAAVDQKVFEGFLFSLPDQDPSGAVGKLPCSTGSAILKAPVAISGETKKAFEFLNRSTRFNRSNNAALPIANAPAPQQVHETQQQPQRRQPERPREYSAPAAAALPVAAPAAFIDDDDEDFVDLSKLDALEEAAKSRAPVAAPPPVQTRQPGPPIVSTATAQQQRPIINPAPSVTALAPTNPRVTCSHGAAYSTCSHQQQHRAEVNEQLAALAVQLPEFEHNPAELGRLMGQIAALRDAWRELNQGSTAMVPMDTTTTTHAMITNAPPTRPFTHTVMAPPEQQQQQQYPPQTHQQQPINNTYQHQQQPMYQQQQQAPQMWGDQSNIHSNVGGQQQQPGNYYYPNDGVQWQQQQGMNFPMPGQGPPPAYANYNAAPNQGASTMYGALAGDGVGGYPNNGLMANNGSNYNAVGNNYGADGYNNNYNNFQQQQIDLQQREYIPWELDHDAINAARGKKIDGTLDPQWRQQNFPWSAEMKRLNMSIFGNTNFRKNQLEICNATMAGHDVFVLMPTGGGKSLCYQLPALLSTGVTVCISPLVSLIQDQVFHLEQMGISCASLSGEVQDWRGVASRARSGDLRVLFITPEKLDSSLALRGLLEDLNSAGRLARVAIDECHCVSQWGHDFRPTYTKLSYFKQNFSNVPILALTATATPRVQDDVVYQLNLDKCLVFCSSFNRDNLRYEVIQKKRKADCIQQIAERILTEFVDKPTNAKATWKVQCGIVYCMTKTNCEETARDLEEALAEGYQNATGLGRRRQRRVKHYHAGMPQLDREAVQKEWTDGEVDIIVATIAFGMGINKPNVRFVFHHSIPKSLEGYLQESGRAGRDGEVSTCILMYNWGDSVKVRNMIKPDPKSGQKPNPEQVQANTASLNAMIAYCEDEAECHRVTLLAHFGERFEREMCRGTCGNCRKRGSAYVSMQDVSQHALKVVDLVRSVNGLFTLNYVSALARGANHKEIKTKKHDLLKDYGCVTAYSTKSTEVERLVRRMVTVGVLDEIVSRQESRPGQSFAASVMSRIQVNEANARELAAGRLKVEIPVVQQGAPPMDQSVPAQGLPGGTKRVRKTSKTAATVAAPAAADPGPWKKKIKKSANTTAAATYIEEEAVDLVDSDSEDDVFDNRQQPDPTAKYQKLFTACAERALQQLNKAWGVYLSKDGSGKKTNPLRANICTALVKAAPRTIEELKQLNISAISHTMKERYGPSIVSAIAQARAFVDSVQRGERSEDELTSFELDITGLIPVSPTRRVAANTQPNTGGGGHQQQHMNNNNIYQQPFIPETAANDYWGADDDDWGDGYDAAYQAAVGVAPTTTAGAAGTFNNNENINTASQPFRGYQYGIQQQQGAPGRVLPSSMMMMSNGGGRPLHQQQQQDEGMPLAQRRQELQLKQKLVGDLNSQDQGGGAVMRPPSKLSLSQRPVAQQQQDMNGGQQQGYITSKVYDVNNAFG